MDKYLIIAFLVCCEWLIYRLDEWEKNPIVPEEANYYFVAEVNLS